MRTKPPYICKAAFSLPMQFLPQSHRQGDAKSFCFCQKAFQIWRCPPKGKPNGISQNLRPVVAVEFLVRESAFWDFLTGGDLTACLRQGQGFLFQGSFQPDVTAFPGLQMGRQ